MYIKYINNEDQLHSTGNHIQYFVIIYNGKESEKVCMYMYIWGFPGGSNSKASARNMVDPSLTPGSGISPGEGNGNSLQYSCLENSMDRGDCKLQSTGSQRAAHD